MAQEIARDEASANFFIDIFNCICCGVVVFASRFWLVLQPFETSGQQRSCRTGAIDFHIRPLPYGGSMSQSTRCGVSDADINVVDTLTRLMLASCAMVPLIHLCMVSLERRSLKTRRLVHCGAGASFYGPCYQILSFWQHEPLFQG